MYRLGTLILIFIFYYNPSEATHDENEVPYAVVVGTVYCDTCFQQTGFTKNSRFISDASVAVDCGGGDTPEQHFHREAKTNEHGEFKIHLPFSVTKQAEKIKSCSVKLLRSSEPFCAVASTATSSSPLHLKSRQQGVHIFSAGFFTFKPLKQPDLCNQNPGNLNSMKPLITVPDTPPSPTVGASLLQLPNPRLLRQLPPLRPKLGQAAQSILPPVPLLPSPGIPIPGIPTIPGIPIPGIPTIPGIPGLSPPPAIPSIPGIPIPTIPGIPGLSPPATPGIPGIPIPGIPTIPGIPGSPPLFGLPPIIPGPPGTGIPGIPPRAGSSTATP